MLRRHAPLTSVLLALAVFSCALTRSLLASAPTAEADNFQAPGAQPPKAPAPAAGSYTGPGSCAAAACHGAVRPPANSRILQTEYTTWIAQDRHARAAQVLSNPVSVRMAKTLGIGMAHSAPKCLACHSLEPAAGQKAHTFTTEGVSCEACHGPASGWLGPHTTRGWTHAQSVALGMYDTKDVVKRTEKCLTCHLGSAEKFVDHEMIAAGHPDLIFDLEAFSAAMPRHWKPAADVDPFATVRSFSIGQLVQLRSSLDRLAERVKGPVWPEYAELDCFACHHSLTRPEESWRQAGGYTDRRPGNPAYNTSRWATARHVLDALDAAAAQELAGHMTSIAREASRLRVNGDQVVSLVAQARATLDRAVARAVSAKFDAAATTRLLRGIASEAEEISGRGERAAEQAAMAMETLYNATATREPNAAARTAFDELFEQFKTPSSYDPRRFVAQVRKIEAALGAR